MPNSRQAAARQMIVHKSEMLFCSLIVSNLLRNVQARLCIHRPPSCECAQCNTSRDTCKSNTRKIKIDFFIYTY